MYCIYFKILLINLFLAVLGLPLLLGLSAVAVSGGYASCCVQGSPCGGSSRGGEALARACGLSSFGMWAKQLWLTGSRGRLSDLWHTGLVAPLHVGSSGTRIKTLSPWVAGIFFTTETPGNHKHITFILP